MLQESERFDMKYKVTGNICKAIVAFANTKGGLIYVGIDDFGNVVGVEDPDGEMLKISNLVHDAICPELLQFVSIDAIELEGKTVLRVEVEPGDDPPYYLAAKGLVPAGVYLRVGPASVPASRSTIRRMIREADGDSFETRRSREQELTFEYAEFVFKHYDVPFEQRNFGTLGLYAADGYYSNLALLISDQNPYELKCATFDDDACTEFLHRIEPTGSVFKQLYETEMFLSAANNRRMYFPGGINHIDVYDYPPECVREGLINCVVHRDYDMNGHTLIKMGRTHLDFISFGGVYDITLHEALNGRSSPRNPKLLSMFHRLTIIEAYGTGLAGIFKRYEREKLVPAVESDNTFLLSLPNINTNSNPAMSHTSNGETALRGSAEEVAELAIQGHMPADVLAEYNQALDRHPDRRTIHERARLSILDSEHPETRPLDLPATAVLSAPRKTGAALDLSLKRALLEYASDAGEFSREEAQEVLQTNRDTALKIINGLINEGKLERVGRARATRYRIAG